LNVFIEILSIFLLTYLFIRILCHYAPQFGLVDIPNERSSHCAIVPSGAGIGFISSVLILFSLFHYELTVQYVWTFVAIFMVFSIGILDDHHDTSPKMKFIVIILATIFLSFDHIVINDLGVFFGLHLSLGWFALPFTIFAVSGFTNALNLIDGLDGLAASISIVILAVFMFIGYQHHDDFMLYLSFFVIISLLAFLYFNWHPASIFMGDSGSLTLGFIISVLAIKSLAYVPTVSILFIAAVPILDTLVVMIRRKRNGKSAFTPDSCHVHHVLRHFFAEDTKRTVFALLVMQLIYSLTGLQFAKDMDEGILLVLFLLNVVLMYLYLKAMIKRQKREC